MYPKQYQADMHIHMWHPNWYRADMHIHMWHPKWYPGLFHTMAYFYVIYSYVFSNWISIKPVEINQYDITMATHDITMGNDVAVDFHCDE